MDAGVVACGESTFPPTLFTLTLGFLFLLLRRVTPVWKIQFCLVLIFFFFFFLKKSPFSPQVQVHNSTWTHQMPLRNHIFTQQLKFMAPSWFIKFRGKVFKQWLTRFCRVIKEHNLKIGFESHNFFKNKEFDIKLLADTLNCDSVLHILFCKRVLIIELILWRYQDQFSVKGTRIKTLGLYWLYL